MAIGLGALVLAIAFHVLGARIAAGEGYGRILPAASGTFSVRPAQHVRRAQTAGWVLSIVGTVSIVDRYWDTEPLLAGGLAVVVLSAVNGLPSLVVAALRNAKRNRA